jgi:hypothetical protein
MMPFVADDINEAVHHWIGPSPLADDTECAPAAFTSDQYESAVRHRTLADLNRGILAALLDGVGEFLKVLLIEKAPWLILVPLDPA